MVPYIGYILQSDLISLIVAVEKNNVGPMNLSDKEPVGHDKYSSILTIYLILDVHEYIIAHFEKKLI